MDSESPSVPGYTLFRKIGSGGFGAVYLARKEGASHFVALKIIENPNARRERRALEKYAHFPDKTNLTEILDWGVSDDAIFYAMPLADALADACVFPPEDFRWQEASLQKRIDCRLASPEHAWFSREEILEIIEPIFDATIALGERGLLHRDIKPANILFFGGKAKLADFGLLDDDRRSRSRIGTPFYSAPSWFSGSGGNPDAYGLATTFYSLITGNLPDTVGRAAYRFPEKRNGSEFPKEQWLHWHRCILRAIAENPAERYVTLSDFKNAIFSEDFQSSVVARKTNGVPARKSASRKKLIAGIAGTAAVGLLFWGGTELVDFDFYAPEKSIVFERLSLQPETKTRLLEKGRAEVVEVAKKGSCDLELGKDFEVGSIVLRSDGSLRLSGHLSGEPRVEMFLSGNECLRFTDKGSGDYVLKSVEITGERDGFMEPDIFVEEGVRVRIIENLTYSFHADVFVYGLLETQKIEGNHYIDFLGSGTVRTEAVRPLSKRLSVWDGMRFEIGKGGIRGSAKCLFGENTIAVIESWEKPASAIELDKENTVTFELQDANGNATNAEIGGRVGGGGKLLKTGAGTLTLSGDNIYSGGTEIRDGVLAAGSISAFGRARPKVGLSLRGRVFIRPGITLAPVRFEITLSDFYKNTAAIFGGGTLLSGTSFRLGMSADDLTAWQQSGRNLRFKIFDEKTEAAKSVKATNFSLDAALSAVARIDDYSDGTITLSPK